MATIRELEMRAPDRVATQGAMVASLSLIDLDGERFVQIDSYGSPERKFVGKRSQSMRLSETAFDQLVALGAKHFNKRA
jgi:hypothetical protein